MRKLSLFLVAGLALAGCDNSTTPTPGQPTGVNANTNTNTDNTSPPKAPDNTGVNKRDQNSDAKTPIDQDETTGAINVTSQIRQRIVNTEGMSINARNVKIITEDGKTTLRGPVESQQEKDTIEKIAKELAGPDNVTNELEVKAP